MRIKRFYWAVGLLVAMLMVIGAACDDDDNGGGDDGTPQATAQTTEGDTTGVTDTEVTLGTHTSLTGPISAFNIIPNFASAYFDYINTMNNGVQGRTINYLVRDDVYEPPLAVDLTRQLVEQDNIFAMFNALGTPNHLQVIDFLQANGVPDMYLATGAIEWVKDPEARPLAFGSNPNYTGEGMVIGNYIADNFAGQKLGVLYQNDDFGLDGLAGVKLGIGDALQVVSEQAYEVTEPDLSLSSQVDRMKADGADVIAAWVTPNFLANSIKHARNDLDWDVPFLITSVSMNELTGLIAGDDVIEGTIGPAATYMAWETDIPGIAKHLEILDQQGIGTEFASVLSIYSQYASELMVETLERAGRDLTREGLVAAAESIQDWRCSVCLFPLSLGPDDHDPAQGMALTVFRNGRIEYTGEAFSYEGTSIADLDPDNLEVIPLPDDATFNP